MRGRKLCCSLLVIIFIVATGLVVTEIILLTGYTSYAYALSKPHLITENQTSSNNYGVCSNGENAVAVNQTCRPCNNFEKSLYSQVCSSSGFIQFIECGSGTIQPASCPLSDEEALRRFWAFEIFVLLGALVSGLVAFKRQGFLEQQASRKLDRRLQDSAEVHHHEQIEMTSATAPLLGSGNSEDETTFMR